MQRQLDEIRAEMLHADHHGQVDNPPGVDNPSGVDNSPGVDNLPPTKQKVVKNTRDSELAIHKRSPFYGRPRAAELYAIASDERIATHGSLASLLPPCWRTIYVITTFSAEDLGKTSRGCAPAVANLTPRRRPARPHVPR